MILEAVVLPVIRARMSAFEEAFAEARAIIESTPGFVSLELHRGVEQPSDYLLLVRWETLEAHTIGFRQSPAYARWAGLLHRFYEPFPEVRHYEPLG